MASRGREWDPPVEPYDERSQRALSDLDVIVDEPSVDEATRHLSRRRVTRASTRRRVTPSRRRVTRTKTRLPDDADSADDFPNATKGPGDFARVRFREAGDQRLRYDRRLAAARRRNARQIK
jgi:hypothetical protein